MKDRVQSMKNLDISREMVWKVVQESKKLRDAAFVSLLFLTGLRVSEIVGGKVQHRYWIDEDYATLYKSQKNIPKERRLRCRLFNKERNIIPLKTFNWERKVLSKTEFRIIKAPVLKTREWPIPYLDRLVPVNDNEWPFIQLVDEYIASLEPGSVLFPFSRVRGFQIVQELSERAFDKGGKDGLWWFNHLFRHKRHSVLAGEYFFDVPQLKAFSGWKSDSMPVFYARMNKRDIVQRFIMADKGL